MSLAEIAVEMDEESGGPGIPWPVWHSVGRPLCKAWLAEAVAVQEVPLPLCQGARGAAGLRSRMCMEQFSIGIYREKGRDFGCTTLDASGSSCCSQNLTSLQDEK